jgi:uncharacterized membrane protein
MAVKFGIFGTFAIVLSSAITFSVYLAFLKKKHRERKAARREEVVRRSLSSASGTMLNDVSL